MNKLIENRADGKCVVAMFGEAHLVLLEGLLKLEGGTMADRIEALEWASMVCPELKVVYES